MFTLYENVGETTIGTSSRKVIFREGKYFRNLERNGAYALLLCFVSLCKKGKGYGGKEKQNKK